MKTSIKKLQNIFNLEANRGYDNGAVLGGLDKVLDSWEAEARADQLTEDLIQAVRSRLRDYSRLSPKSRAEILTGLWRRIQREEPEFSSEEAGASRRLPDAKPGPPGTGIVSAAEKSVVPEEQQGENVETPGVSTAVRDSTALPPPPQELSQEPPQAPSQERTPPPETPSPDPDRVLGTPEAPTVEPRQMGEGTDRIPSGPASTPLEEQSMAGPKPTPRISGPSQAGARTSDLDELEADSKPIGGDGVTPGRPEAASAEKFEQPAALEALVTVLPGVGERHAQTLGRLDLYTLGDMLYHFPRRYDDYTQIKPINRLFYGEEVTVIGTVQNASSRKIHNRKLQIVEALVSDGSGSLRLTWFNQPWIIKRLRQGTHIVVSGKIDQYLGRLTMNNPEWELLERENLHTNRIVPVYPLTARLTQRWLRRMMHKVVTYWAPRVNDPLPASVISDADLMPLPTALLNIHFPDTLENLQEARHRLAFDEIFLLQMGVLRQRRAWQNRTARVFEAPADWLLRRKSALPFSLTGAQNRALQDLRSDLASGKPMNRLLQGDVGSGKTVIAALGIAMITREGAQAALMTPTGILAEQHFTSLSRLLVGDDGLEPDQIRLLLGGTPESEKREIRQALASGDVKLVIGTHALIEDPVMFAELELVVIDEQHRFGVKQRAALRSKGPNPHLLVMTATPIPRSLALTIYGDLDLSIIDEMPPGRMEVTTYLLYPTERERAYALIRREVEAGRQAFIIYPLVEESEKTEVRAAVEEHQRLQNEVFPGWDLGLLHGRMSPSEKELVMTKFRDQEFPILVSTSVVEVGVDVPHATAMLIEGANRFGLSQLHQFRGRVGRGRDQSYCLLIPQGEDAVENERLAALLETNDGFVLAERDLEQRGPGEFLGTRQAGFAKLQMASLADIRLIEKARRQAQRLFEDDPQLEDPAHRHLIQAIDSYWEEGKGDIS